MAGSLVVTVDDPALAAHDGVEVVAASATLEPPLRGVDRIWWRTAASDVLAPARVADAALLADRHGWPRATVWAFEPYRGSPDRYDLLDGDELDRQLVASGPFRRERQHAGAALAPDLRFPTLVYERRS